MKKYIYIILSIFVGLFLVSCNTHDPLQEILDQIEIPTEVTNNLELLNEYSYNGYTAEAKWHSTNSSVISSTGEIVVDLEDKTATLQLKLSMDGRTLTKNFDIVVKGNTDLLLLYALYNSKLKNLPRILTEDLEIYPTYEQDGKEVEAIWESSNPSVISNDGKVTRTDKDEVVTMTVTLKRNLATRFETFEFTVLQNEDTLPINNYHKASVYTGIIPGEAPDPLIPGCFPGALYRKVVSSRDYWIGIEGVITLGEFIPDEQRYDNSKLSYYLDNPSIYMGGNANFESDIGLTWSIGHESAANPTVSRKGIAYRPFWRYITAMESKDGKRENIYKNAYVGDYQFYYFPGDKIRMSVITPKPNYMQMRIELLELTTIPKYVEQRNKYNLPENFERIFITEPFPSEGMGIVKTEFKRVNAIDQVSNESKPTINTNAKVNDAKWHEVYLYRMIDGKLYKVPMTENRSAGMICPLGSNKNGDFTNAIKLSYTGVDKNLGGEIITLDPNNGTGRLYNSFIIVPSKREWEFV